MQIVYEHVRHFRIHSRVHTESYCRISSQRLNNNNAMQTLTLSRGILPLRTHTKKPIDCFKFSVLSAFDTISNRHTTKLKKTFPFCLFHELCVVACLQQAMKLV